MTDHPTYLLRYAFLDRFTCLGAECEDTCCIGWGMQVDEERKELYKKKAPELLDAVTLADPEDITSLVMKRNNQTDYCVKFDAGLCGIQKNYGETFLGDACYFFPRITRNFGHTTVMAATLSCPEIARLSLLSPDAFELKEATTERLPVEIKNYLPQQISPVDAITITHAFLDAASDKTITPEHALCRIISVAKSLDNIDITRWKDAVPFLLRTADSRFPTLAEEPADPYRLLHALAGLMAATKRSHHPRLMYVFNMIEKALEAHIDWETLEITSDDIQLSASKTLKKLWDTQVNDHIRDIQRKWLQTELAMASFPFAGMGKTAFERIVIIAVRFATVKLAMMSYLMIHHSLPDDHKIIEIVQGLSRFLDHLSDPKLSLAIYADAGWTREGRLFSLLGFFEKITDKQSVIA